MKRYLPILLLALFGVYGLAEGFNFGLNFGFGGAKNNQKYEPLTVSLAWSPMSSSFGNVTTGQSKVAFFTITNSGNDVAEDVAVSTSSPFSVYSTVTLGNISSSRTRIVKVRYTPTAAQTDTAYVNYSAPNIARSGAKLRGTGVAPAVAVLGWSPTSHDFGNVTVNTESAHQQFTLSNTGTATATGLSLSVGNAVFRNTSSTCGDTIAASASCTVKTAFTPALAEAYSSYLRASASGISDAVLTLTGTGATSAHTYSDNFNRANETPIASPWVMVSGAANVNLSSNAAQGSASNSGAYYSGTYTSDQFSEATSTTWGTLKGVFVRCQGGAETFYCFRIDNSTSGKLIKYINGTPTQIGSTYTLSLTSGSKIGIKVIGSTITPYTDAGDLSPVSDTSIPSGGAPGIFLSGITSLDNWAGGDI